ncbi:DUF551 domain-containing protein [Enterobacter roggenkampii]|nr:DUF551 domain-containing protein [Enterobacter roggenkampii]WJS52805.1 DUF551 domain-containing protein [Enterobacter roggenkampii]
MSTITKEWLQKAISQHESMRDEIPFGLDEDDSNTLAALRIALASLEAEPVCVIDQSNLDYLKSGSDADVWPASRAEMGDVLLYRSAPPAPVSVPDRSMFEKWWESEYGSPLDSWDSLRTTDGYYDDGIDGQFEAWNACRAAMLQGADGNSPVIPDGWVACSERMPEEGSKVIVFRPRASESNDPPVKTATYKGGREYYHGFDCYCEPTHWMPLPAAPQQEVK